ncbi:hypothetical protein [Chryseobacterium sp. KMC2]|uniref:hypothetical protein n=1 Tax=Chryseobacterium sp. KMC2 TaxID=2800705 RepID=UPI0019214EEC|nr:hypothetical protein [Chryseobacterium sp. KMC2]MBL3547267.1 hypothetical protein [Chryseobacterium sp. KMC2]
MIIKYYLNSESNKNLYCQLSDENIKVTFDMKYNIDPQSWDYSSEKLCNSDPHFFTLKNFKIHLFSRSVELQKSGKDSVVEVLKEEALHLFHDSGINGISKNVFNFYADKFGLDRYDKYIRAFEKYTGLQQKDYKVEIIGYMLHFHTENVIYEMDTYTGRSLLLKEIIKNKRYLDIMELTEVSMWSEIYDENIGKHNFLSKMSDEFEMCLNDNFKRTAVLIEANESIKNRKTEIRKMFQKFIDQSNKNVNWIDLAWEISEEILFPLAVITMTSIFDLTICCQEYCELNFYNENEEWETVFLDCGLEEDNSIQGFHIRLLK